MGLLDRFRTSTPSRRPLGESGRGHVSGFLALEELNTALRGRYGFQIFDEMYRTDPDVRKSVAMVCNPIIGGTWSVEPFGGDDAEQKDLDAAKFVEWALFEAMRPGLKGHLAQALPVLIRSGFAPFEQVWGTLEYDGKTVLAPKTLGLRLPRTIQQFFQDDAGELTEIVQWTPTGKTVNLPASDLLYYRIGAEGDNWEGTSLLRPVYKSWYLKDKIERLDAIAIEREATGVPIAYPPKNVSDPVLDDVEQVLSNIRTAEQGYILSPGPKADHAEPGTGWTFEILSAKQGDGRRDTEPSLNYHSSKIAAGFIAEFMRLGQAQVGAKATADVQQDPFLAGVEALSGEVEDQLNDLVSRLVALNLEVDEPPKLTMSLVDSTSLDQLATYVGTLIDKGAFHPDDDLEDFLREKADLPPANADEREERKAQADELRKAAAMAPKPPPEGAPAPPARTAPPPPAPKPTEDPDLLAPHAYGRPLRWWEQHIELAVIDSAISGARERFEAAAGDPAREVGRTYTAAALKGNTAQPKVAGALPDAIRGELGDLYETGQRTVVTELMAQKAEQAPAALYTQDKALKDLTRRAKLAADSIAARIWQAVSRASLAHPGDEAAIQEAGEKEAAAALRAEAQLHASAALNAGRSDAADENSDLIAGSRYTSILDRNRCQTCAGADDDLLRPLDDPVRLRNKPPNRLCFGGSRCRCIEFFQFADEEGGGGLPPPPPTIDTPSSPSVGEHFDVTGGTQDLRGLVDNQLAAIQAVHRMPAEMPRIPLRVGDLDDSFGLFHAKFRNGEIVEPSITVNRHSVEQDPPIISVVHEIGHFLDAFGFGHDVPLEQLLAKNYLSGGNDLAEWRDAAKSSNAYKQLATTATGEYPLRTREVFARSYEQWIALRSGNQVLADKIRARNAQDPNFYWTDADFAPIAVALDRFMASRGLR